MRIAGAAAIGSVMNRGIAHLVVTAGLITPDMTKIEIMPYLVGSCSSQVELGVQGIVSFSKSIVVDHHAIGGK